MDEKRAKKRRASRISGGIFMISLGVLLYTGWWWPGILIAVGLAAGAELVFQGKIARGIGTLAFFCAIPLVIWIIQDNEIPWTLVGPLILIGIGIIIVVKTLFLREESS